MKNIPTIALKIMYNKSMMKSILFCFVLIPTLAFARIPSPNQTQVQQNGVHGAYTPHAQSWGTHQYDPNMAGQNFSGSHGQFAQYQRQANRAQMGISALEIFTSKGTFGEKVKRMALGFLDQRFAKPAQQRLEMLTLNELYAMTSGRNQQNQAYQDCQGCIHGQPQPGQPGHANPNSVGNTFTQFGVNNNNAGQSGGTGSQGLGGVVTPFGQ